MKKKARSGNSSQEGQEGSSEETTLLLSHVQRERRASAKTKENDLECCRKTNNTSVAREQWRHAVAYAVSQMGRDQTAEASCAQERHLWVFSPKDSKNHDLMERI